MYLPINFIWHGSDEDKPEFTCRPISAMPSLHAEMRAGTADVMISFSPVDREGVVQLRDGLAEALPVLDEWLAANEKSEADEIPA